MTRHQRTLYALVGSAIALSAILTGLAFALSYAHLQSIAGTNGLPSLWRSWMWPATVDLFIVIGDVLTVAALLVGRPPLRGLLVTSGGTGASIAINVAGVGAHRPAMEYVIAAVPPIAAQVAFSVIMWQLHDLMARGQAEQPVTSVYEHPAQDVTTSEQTGEQPAQPNAHPDGEPTQDMNSPLHSLPNDLISTEHACDMLGVSRSTFGRYTSDKRGTPKLTAAHVDANGGKHYRRADVLRLTRPA